MPLCLLCVKESTDSGVERNNGVGKVNSSTQEVLSSEGETRRELIIVESQWTGQGTKETGRDRQPVQTKWSDDASFRRDRQKWF